MRTGTLIVVLMAAAAAAGAEVTSLDLGNGVRLEAVLIKAGSFLQGSPPGEAKRGEDENQHQVMLTRDYLLGRHAVTRGQFGRFIAESGYRTEAEKGTSGGFGWNGSALEQNRRFSWRSPGYAQTDDDPITIVTYDDAMRFCEWLSRKTGRAFQLPTEAEWEYACRAGTTTAWHNGDGEKDAAEIAWFRPIAENRTHPVASLKPNAWGLYIGGNVYEWCRDWYGPYPGGLATNPEQTNPNLSDKPRRVLRGGSWLREVQHTRSAARYRNTPASRNADNGFRVLTYQVGTPPAKVEAEAPSAAVMAPPSRPTVSPAPPPPVAPRPPASIPTVHVQRSVGISWLGGLLCPLAFCGVLGLVVVIIYKTLAQRPANGLQEPGLVQRAVRPVSGAGPAGIRTQIADDGFWLMAGIDQIDQTIHYQYEAGGRAISGDVLYRPDANRRQFVYTGARPEKVTVVGTGTATDVAPPLITADDEPMLNTGSVVRPIIVGETIRRTSTRRYSAY